MLNNIDFGPMTDTPVVPLGPVLFTIYFHCYQAVILIDTMILFSI